MRHWQLQPPGDISSPDRRDRVRPSVDFGHQWPLWEAATDKLAMEPPDYGFSGELTNLLARWFALWEPIADFDVGQPVCAPARETPWGRLNCLLVRRPAPLH